MLKYTVIALGGVVVGWLLRQFVHIPNKGDTDRFFKRSGERLRFYTTPTLIGTILVGIAVLNVAFDEVTGFMMVEEKGQIVNPRRYELFRIKIGLAALTTWYAFINPSWQRARQKQKDSENTEPPIPPHARQLG